MRHVYLLLQIAVLYIFYLLGSWIQETFSLFIPGSIIGMLLLFVLLSTKIIKSEWIEKGAELLVRNLSLLFLPVTIGIINYLNLFAGKGMLLFVIILASTLLVMLSSGIASQWVWQRMEHKNE